MAFGLRCNKAGVRPSMGPVGDAMCESVFATLDCELPDRRKVTINAAARMAVFAFIEGRYNPSRRHSAIGCKSSIAFERTAQNQLRSATG